MVPVLFRGHALKSFLHWLGVVPVDVVIDFGDEFGDTGEVLAVVHLGFQVAEEVFHDRVVITGAFARHGLDSLMGFEDGLPRGVLVLESLIGVHEQTGSGFFSSECLSQALCCEYRGR